MERIEAEERVAELQELEERFFEKTWFSVMGDKHGKEEKVWCIA
jgi:hypothetical protein